MCEQYASGVKGGDKNTVRGFTICAEDEAHQFMNNFAPLGWEIYTEDDLPHLTKKHKRNDEPLVTCPQPSQPSTSKGLPSPVAKPIPLDLSMSSQATAPPLVLFPVLPEHKTLINLLTSNSPLSDTLISSIAQFANDLEDEVETLSLDLASDLTKIESINPARGTLAVHLDLLANAMCVLVQRDKRLAALESLIACIAQHLLLSTQENFTSDLLTTVQAVLMDIRAIKLKDIPNLKQKINSVHSGLMDTHCFCTLV